MQEVLHVRFKDKILKISNPAKILFPNDGLTKADLVRYYASVAPVMVKHLRDRPLSVVRYPDGIKSQGFYQKNAPEGTPSWVKLFPMRSRDGKVINFVLCDDEATLVYLASLGAIEINPWLSRYFAPEYPDFAVFDLDPAGKASWSDVVDVALAVREVLWKGNLTCYPKVSGATGVHIYVPVENKYTYREISIFVREIAKIVQMAFPEKVTLERSVSMRGDKVYIDYPQNARGQTICSVYSVRAQDGAFVSMPVTWDELMSRDIPRFSVVDAPERISAMGDLFEPVLSSKQNIDSFLSRLPEG